MPCGSCNHSLATGFISKSARSTIFELSKQTKPHWDLAVPFSKQHRPQSWKQTHYKQKPPKGTFNHQPFFPKANPPKSNLKHPKTARGILNFQTHTKIYKANIPKDTVNYHQETFWRTSSFQKSYLTHSKSHTSTAKAPPNGPRSRPGPAEPAGELEEMISLKECRRAKQW